MLLRCIVERKNEEIQLSYPRRGGVRELSWLAHPPSATVRTLAVLVAFLNESGTHDETGQQPGSQVAGMGGVVAPTEVWEEIEAEWLDVLKRWQVPAYHMSACLNQRKPFEGWRQEQAEGLTAELFDVFTDRKILRVCASVSVQDYDQLIDSHLKSVMQHPYFFCLTLCVNQILEWLPPDYIEPVGFVFDEQQQ